MLLTGCGGSSLKSSGEGDLASGQEGTSNQDTKKSITNTLVLQIWHSYEFLSGQIWPPNLVHHHHLPHIPPHHNLPSCRLSLLSILLRLYLTAVLKLTSFMSWRSRRKGIGDGRQRVSSAHCDPLSYISSICLFVSFSNGCHWSLAASPHSQIACLFSKMGTQSLTCHAISSFGTTVVSRVMDT